MDRLVIGGRVMVVYHSCATPEGTIGRYTDRDEAVNAAFDDGAHVHEEPGSVYFTCNDAACEDV